MVKEHNSAWETEESLHFLYPGRTEVWYTAVRPIRAKLIMLFRGGFDIDELQNMARVLAKPYGNLLSKEDIEAIIPRQRRLQTLP
jgi:hypothetical protein